MGKLDLSFGILIAYIGPGLIALIGMSDFFPYVSDILGGSSKSPTAGGVVLLLILSLMMGMLVNAIGFITIRKIFSILGSKPPSSEDYANLETEKLQLLSRITEYTYRYYECYCNLCTSIALVTIFYLIEHLKLVEVFYPFANLLLTLIAIVILIIVAFYSHKVYCKRMSKLLEYKSSIYHRE